jgi:deazaflavin-dependent oxidoreductase (nitroreductase family)
VVNPDKLRHLATLNARSGKFQSTRTAARLAGFVERYVLNPQMRLGLALGLAPRAFALLETIGRNSGKPRRTPVGNGLLGDTFWLVSEYGRRAGYVHNIERTPRVRVKVGRSWRAGTAQILDDDDPSPGSTRSPRRSAASAAWTRPSSASSCACSAHGR